MTGSSPSWQALWGGIAGEVVLPGSPADQQLRKLLLWGGRDDAAIRRTFTTMQQMIRGGRLGEAIVFSIQQSVDREVHRGHIVALARYFRAGVPVHYLAQLLAHPGREFHAIDLEAADRQPATATPRGPRPRAGERELAVRRDLWDAGVLLDATAKAAYRARVRDLRAELEEAEAFHDSGRAANARAELDFLVAGACPGCGVGRT